MSESEEFIGWCMYCKAEIYADQDYAKRKGKWYHDECYDLMKEELDDE